MPSADFAFDDFVDDCFVGEDALCDKSKEESLELVASQLISELVADDDDDLIAA